MDFIAHTTNWIKGEIFEGICIILFGMLLSICAFLFWKYGGTPAAKSIVLPIAVVGLFAVGSGASMYFSNQKRLVEYPQIYKQNESAFIQAEKQRVEDFQYMYLVTKIVATIAFTLLLIAFWFTTNTTFQGISIGLSILALSTIVVDLFSEERARIYYDIILSNLG